jgi:hypothetical protein
MRQLIRLPHNVNDAAFTAAVVETFRSLHGGRTPQSRTPKRRTGSQ